MSLGLQGAGGVAGMQGALRQRIMDQLAAQKQAQEIQIQQQEMALRLRHESGLEADRQTDNVRLAQVEADRRQVGQDKQTVSDFTAQPQGARLPTPLALRSRALGLPTTDIPAQPVTQLGGFSSLPADQGGQGPGLKPQLQSLRVRALDAAPDALLTSTADPSNPLSQPAAYGRGATEADVNKTQLEARQARQDAETERGHREAEAQRRATEANTEAYRGARLQQPKDTSAADNGRMDRSYTSANSSLEALRKPLADQAERFGRLTDTINQHSPQADALIAPEMLTVMAGGIGSGLRMNEAEIARIVGGRSNFESLKAQLNKWSLNPKEALSVTESQRGQIRDLMKAVGDKSSKRLAILNQASQDLIDAPDVGTHRRIVAQARKAIDDIGLAAGDSGGDTTTTTTTSQAPRVRYDMNGQRIP